MFSEKNETERGEVETEIEFKVLGVFGLKLWS